MNIDVKWDNDDKTIIRYEYKNGWDWNDYFSAINGAAELLDTVEHQVDIIMDFRNARLVPQGAIGQVQRAFSHPRHPNIGITVFVGANGFLRAIESIGRKLVPSAARQWDLAFVVTLEDAYRFLKAQKKLEQPT